jgi:hypothetical protein
MQEVEMHQAIFIREVNSCILKEIKKGSIEMPVEIPGGMCKLAVSYIPNIKGVEHYYRLMSMMFDMLRHFAKYIHSYSHTKRLCPTG